MTERQFEAECEKISRNIEARRLYKNYSAFWDMTAEEFKKNYNLKKLEIMIDNLSEN